MNKNTKNLAKNIDKGIKKSNKKAKQIDKFLVKTSKKAIKELKKDSQKAEKIISKNIKKKLRPKNDSSKKSGIISKLLNSVEKISNFIEDKTFLSDGRYDHLKQMRKRKGSEAKESNDEIQKQINKKFKTQKYGFVKNCAFCTAAYDLRKRGYDVEASAVTTEDCNTAEEIMSWYKGAELIEINRTGEPSETIVSETIKTEDENGAGYSFEIENALTSRYENGAYGHFLLWWQGGGGHDIVWEIEDGKAMFRDAQTNEKYDSYELSIQMLSIADSAQFFRSDNLELNDKIAKVANRED